MDGPGKVFRETTQKVKKPPPRRIPTRVVTKHLQQKYLLSGFAIHAFLSAPVYLCGIVVESDKKLIIRIWPAILYQAVGQICQSVLLHTAEKCQGKVHSRSENRKIFLVATFITCLGITVCGFLFTSAWITMTTTTQVIAVIVYGLFGGIGSSLIYSRTHIILEAARPKEDKYVRKTIRIFGEAFCQIFLSFVFTSLRTLYGTSQTFILMAALLINLIPLSLLITREDVDAKNPKKPLTINPQTRFEFHHNSESGLLNSNPDQVDGIEMQQKTWRNPKNLNEIHCNYMAVIPDESYTAYVNPNGVEIMEIIPEEDETVSAFRSSCGTIYTSKVSVEVPQPVVIETNTNFGRIQKFSKEFTNQMLGNMTENVVNPLQKAIVISTLYPATFLQSIDIFSYVMCLVVLPGLAIDYHALKFAEIPFLFSLLAFPWMCFALMTPRFGNDLVNRKMKWYALGCVSKALSLIFISISSSKLLLSLASVLLGFGQAVSMFLQDLVIESGVSGAQWIDVKYPMYSTNGCLIVLWGILAHIVIINFGFQASVALVALLYLLGISFWYCVFAVRAFVKA